MPISTLKVNNEIHQVEADPETPLLWILRDHLGLTGTKFGCGAAQCGACTIHIDGVATRCCTLPVKDAEGSHITTIENLSTDGNHHLQELWREFNVPQCGYCQSGMLMAAAALLESVDSPTDADIDAHMTNICRCGTYPRVRAAIKRAAGQQANRKGTTHA